MLSAWIVSLMFAGIQGNFPLNDDWAFARSVKVLMDTGSFQLTGWMSMPVITQVYWGYLFTSVFGFSFEVLRYSTLVLSIAGLVFTYLIILDSVREEKETIFAFLVIAFNPLYYSLSATFMTDVPFYAFFAGAVYFFIKYFRTEDYTFFITAVIFTIASAFIRQLGAVLLLAFAIVYSFKKNEHLVKKIIPYVLFLALVAAIVLMQDYIASPVISPFLRNKRINIFLRFFDAFSIGKLFEVIKAGYFGLIYIGLFLFPLLIFYIKNVYKRIPFYLLLLGSVGMLAALIKIDKILPLRPNMITQFGTGPTLLKDVDVFGHRIIPFIPWSIWLLLTFIGITGSVILLFLLFRYIRVWRNKVHQLATDDKLPVLFILSVLVLSYIPICITEFYDRYLIIYLPLTAYLIMKTGIVKPSRYMYSAAYVLTGIIIIYSVVSTHDYFAWSKARWEAVDHLLYEERVSPSMIEGGFEFNGWYHYRAEFSGIPGISNWWSAGDKYFISFGDVNGYRKLKSFPYYSWLFLRQGNIYILMKE